MLWAMMKRRDRDADVSGHWQRAHDWRVAYLCLLASSLSHHPGRSVVFDIKQEEFTAELENCYTSGDSSGLAS